MQYIIARKLQKPSLPQSYLPRAHLVSRLLDNLNKSLSFVAAPAGYGKTSLLTEVVNASGSQGLWYTLDKRDDNFSMFKSYWLSLLETLSGNLKTSLDAPVTTAWELLDVTLSVLDTTEQQLILVLDNFHHIKQSEDIHGFIQGLLGYLPPHCHLMISGRDHSSLNLAKLVVNQDLTLLTQEALALTPDESHDLAVLFNYSGDSKQLHETYQGWLALHLFFMQQPLSDTNTQPFTLIERYLDDEFLNSFDTQQQHLIYKTLLLNPFTNQDLKDAGITQVAFIEKLCANTQVLEHINGTYQYTPFIKDYLLSRLHENSQLAKDINKELGLALWEKRRANALPLLHSAGPDVLAKALATLDYDFISQHPLWLDVQPWLSHLHSDNMTPAMALLNADAAVFNEPLRAYTYYKQALTSNNLDVKQAAQVGLLRALSHAERYEQLLEESKPLLKQLKPSGGSNYCLALNYVAGALSQLRRYNESEPLFQTMLQHTIGEAEYLRVLALFGLSSIHEFNGDTQRALLLDEEICAYYQHKHDPYHEAISLNGLATSYLTVGRLEEALECAEKALKMMTRLGVQRKAALHACTLGDVLLALNNPQRALDVFKQAVSSVSQRSFIYRYALIGTGRAYYAMTNYEDALRIAEQGHWLAQEQHCELTQAHALLLKGVVLTAQQHPSATQTYHDALSIYEHLGAKSYQVKTLKLLKHNNPDVSQTISTLESQLRYTVHLYEYSATTQYHPGTTPEQPALSIITLGRIQVQKSSTPLENWSGRKPLELVLFLASKQEGVTRDDAINALWTDEQLSNPEQQFSIALSRARKTLGGRDSIIRNGKVYRFGDYTINEDVTNILNCPPDAPANTLINTLSHYKGEYLPGYYEDWILERRTRVQTHVLHLISVLLSNSAPGVPLVEQAKLGLSLDPVHELSFRYLFTYYLNENQHLAAQTLFNTFSRELADFGGVIPEDLQELSDTHFRV